jgi:hypothetical protein
MAEDLRARLGGELDALRESLAAVEAGKECGAALPWSEVRT